MYVIKNKLTKKWPFQHAKKVKYLFDLLGMQKWPFLQTRPKNALGWCVKWTCHFLLLRKFYGLLLGHKHMSIVSSLQLVSNGGTLLCSKVSYSNRTMSLCGVWNEKRPNIVTHAQYPNTHTHTHTRCTVVFVPQQFKHCRKQLHTLLSHNKSTIMNYLVRRMLLLTTYCLGN